ncbi:unnamed protein product [Protopolystoma xenopodis]|uniref:Myosin motor domain-containing protein n=1 Tax=Protopolystoma xenopodis TaxID=117903 RepID=A0A3S4ZZI3_9PLAT|nr:unnamed protein product [Protopolystoma xenopodis]
MTQLKGELMRWIQTRHMGHRLQGEKSPGFWFLESPALGLSTGDSFTYGAASEANRDSTTIQPMTQFVRRHHQMVDNLWFHCIVKVSPADLRAALISRRLFVNGECVTALLAVAHAYDLRDALSKTIYGQLFIWLVERINNAVYRPLSDSQNGASTSLCQLASTKILPCSSYSCQNSPDTDAFRDFAISGARAPSLNSMSLDILGLASNPDLLRKAEDLTQLPTPHHSNCESLKSQTSSFQQSNITDLQAESNDYPREVKLKTYRSTIGVLDIFGFENFEHNR